MLLQKKIPFENVMGYNKKRSDKIRMTIVKHFSIISNNLDSYWNHLGSKQIVYPSPRNSDPLITQPFP